MIHSVSHNVNILNKSALPITASLAPMAGYTDHVFRALCGSFGAAYATSEMISSVALVMNDTKTAALARIGEGEPPVFLQIFGHDPKIMKKAADILLSGTYSGCNYTAPPAGIDINMGCPVRKIVSSGDGSRLMTDIRLAAQITSSVKEACEAHGVPLSVKFRLGWDREHINVAEFACAILRAGADRITIHCRTREQMYSPSADPSYAAVVNDFILQSGIDRSKIILCGNGDISSYTDAEQYVSLGCDEVSIGRAALGNPWIFKEMKAPESFVKPSFEETVALVRRFVADVAESHGEKRGILESRSRAAYFIRGTEGAAKVREKLNCAVTLAEFDRILSDFARSK